MKKTLIPLTVQSMRSTKRGLAVMNASPATVAVAIIGAVVGLAPRRMFPGRHCFVPRIAEKVPTRSLPHK
jgi:hypothetical protein